MKNMWRVGLVAVLMVASMAATATTYVFQVGINDYEGTEDDLAGCVNDVKEMRDLFVSKFGVEEANIRMILDKGAGETGFIDGMKWLIGKAKAGDQVIFQYSGHGGQMDTTDLVAEPDGKEEVLVLADDVAVPGKFFKDFADDFKSRGIDVTLIFDSCFSGGMSRDVNFTEMNFKGRKLQGKTGGYRGLGNVSGKPGFKKASSRGLLELKARVHAKSPKSGGSAAFLLASSEDQPSADLQFKDNKPAHGAFTFCLLILLQESVDRPISELVSEAKEILDSNDLKQGPNTEADDPKRLEQPLVLKS